MVRNDPALKKKVVEMAYGECLRGEYRRRSKYPTLPVRENRGNKGDDRCAVSDGRSDSQGIII